MTRRRFSMWLVVPILGASACFPPDQGRTPPLAAIYFPVGIALAPDPLASESVGTSPTRMFVVNSDFDLQYNAGTVQEYDLDVLRSLLPTYCNSDEDCAAGTTCDSTPLLENQEHPSYWCVDASAPPVDPNQPDRACDTLNARVHQGTPSAPTVRAQGFADRLLYPSRCSYVDTSLRGLLTGKVEIGAFATDIVYRQNPNRVATSADGGTVSSGSGPEGRLFIPVRGDATLHWIDVNGSTLDCGQRGSPTEACDANHQRGSVAAAENTVAATLPPEPFGIAISDDLAPAGGLPGPTEAIVTTHQSDGEVALFVNHWLSGSDDGPKLQSVLGNALFNLSTADLPLGTLAIASVPEPKFVIESRVPQSGPTGAGVVGPVPYQPSFLMTFRNAAEIQLVRYFPDEATASACTAPTPGGGTQVTNCLDPPFLEASRSELISTNSDGSDSRGIAIDAATRQGCEKGCQEPVLMDCLEQCAKLPLDVYVSNRAPATLLMGRTQPRLDATAGAEPSVVPDDDLPVFFSTLIANVGASRVVLGNVMDPSGKPVRRVFVVCFDSHQIFVYDPAARRIETVIDTGHGPHAFVVDSANGYGYIGMFTDSYIGVVDLHQRHAQAYGKIVLNVGAPAIPRASK